MTRFILDSSANIFTSSDKLDSRVTLGNGLFLKKSIDSLIILFIEYQTYYIQFYFFQHYTNQ